MPGLPDSGEERRHLNRILSLAGDAARAESKLAALRRLLCRTSEQAIVFTEYRDTLEHLASALGGVSLTRLHGGLTPRERAEALRQFTAGSVRVLLATDAASEGLNLHHRCRLVVNLELPWTPLRLEQRVGRVDRIGQRRRVHALHLIAAATSEELVLARLAARVGRVRAAIGGGAFAALPSEHDIAESVLGVDAGEPPTSLLPAGVITAELIREGREEARRILLARSLLLHAAAEPPETRAVLTSMRRRHRSCSPRSFWVFRSLLVDARGRGLSDELVALACNGTTLLDDLQEAAGCASDQRLAAFAQELEAALRLWLRREAAVATRLRAAHARLSAQLLQRGLFDRRNDRAAVAQSSLIDEALARSAARSNELLERQGLRVESRSLVFAVTFE